MEMKDVLKEGRLPLILCDHRLQGEVRPISIGQHSIYAGGGTYLTQHEKDGFDLRIDLRDEVIPSEIDFGVEMDNCLYLPIVDFKTVAEEQLPIFRWYLFEVYLRMCKGERVLVYCAGGHGRTGLFLASLLALVEPELEDPVVELRHRYCSRAVETPAQAEQVANMHSAFREIHQVLKGK